MTQDRITAAWQRFVESVIGPRIDYLASYPSRVVAQASDGSLEVVPDSPRVPGMVGVPIRYGIPGVTAKVAAGARVNVAFDGGDPASPVATMWEPDGLLEINVTASTKITVNAPSVILGTGERPVACVGDPVSFTVISVPPASTLANSGGPVIGTLVGVGVIMEGQGRVKAGGG